MDYKGIEALYTVLEMQSFEAAAKKLFITQSAISQRIKGLEAQYGEPMLIRTLPYVPTKIGCYLIGHFKQISLLEEALKHHLGSKRKLHISIALNRDSLETWFLDLIEDSTLLKDVILEVIADDQELTIDYLKRGLVSACLSTSHQETLGCKTTFLGNMEYLLVASPKFFKEYFFKAKFENCLLQAPAIKFDRNDHLHKRYLEKFFGLSDDEVNYQIVPSVKGFKKYVLLGYGYALIPRIDIVGELKSKKLVQIHDKTWKIPMYWHHWSIKLEAYHKFNTDIIKKVTEKLK